MNGEDEDDKTKKTNVNKMKTPNNHTTAKNMKDKQRKTKTAMKKTNKKTKMYGTTSLRTSSTTLGM